MMKKQDLYYIYDSVWAGMYTDFKPFYTESEQRMDPEDILEICRYAFRYYLRWNADAVHKRLTEDILKQMKLYSLVRTYPFPEEVSEPMRIPYLVGMLYPQYYRFDPEQAAEQTYSDLVEGRQEKPPKGFFTNTEDGRKRAKICFRYMVNNYKIFASREDAFRFFSTVEGRKFLNKHKLKYVSKYFGTDMDFVYEAYMDLGMTSDEHEECLFCREKYKSRLYMEKYIRRIKKQQREERKLEECSE